jgi:integral membrane protein (TIGR01906 family)
MRPAPWPVGLLFGVSLAVAVLLVGPLSLFNPIFTSLLQARHEVAASFGTRQAEVDRVTNELLVDIYTDGEFDAAFGEGQIGQLQPALLDERERSHMHDVSRLVRILAGVALLAVVLGVVSGTWLNREPRRQGRIMLLAGGGIGAVGLLVAIAFAVAFEPTFLAFHAIFFPPGTFLFEPGSNLITLFPEPFWFDASLAAGATVLLAAAIVALLGLWRLRSGGPTPLPA